MRERSGLGDSALVASKGGCNFLGDVALHIDGAFPPSVCSRGNVRSETLRAFSFEEMKRILGKMV